MVQIYNFFEITLGWNMFTSWIATLTVIAIFVAVVAVILGKIFRK